MTSMPPHRTKRLDRREHARMPVDVSARLVAGASVLVGRIENLGTKGAAFITEQMEPALPVGERAILVAPGAGDAGADLEFAGSILRTDDYCDGSSESRSYAVGFDQSIDVPQPDAK